MRLNILFITSLCMLATLESHAETVPPAGNWVALTTASKLYCRAQPTTSAVKKSSFPFASPVELNLRSKNKTTIGGLESYWYHEKSQDCWLFGGYLKLTQKKHANTVIFKPELVSCNVICGGNSCMPTFMAYVVGNFYAAKFYLEDYCAEEEGLNIYCVGQAIGKYKKQGTRANFGPAIAVAYFERNKKQFHPQNTNSFNRMKNSPYGFNLSGQSLIEENDSTGTYYKQDLSAMRKKSRQICNQINQSASDGSHQAIFHTAVEMTIPEMLVDPDLKYTIPLVAGKKY